MSDIPFSKLVEAWLYFVWLLDIDGRTLILNRPARGLFDGDQTGRPWRDVWPEDLHIAVDRALVAARRGEAFQFRIRLPEAGSSGRYLNATVTPVRGERGEVLRLLAVAEDVTAQVESSAFLNTVIDVLPLALTVKDVRTGRIVLGNRAAEDLFDRPDGLVGLRPEEALPAYLTADEAAGGRTAATHRVETAEGVRFLAERRVATYDDEGARHIISLTNDVTQQNLDAEALRQALEETEHASRTKSALLTNLSHELRTPLNGLMASVGLLAAQRGDSSQDELLDMISASARALEQRFEELLAASQIDAAAIPLRSEPFEVAALIRGLAQDFGPQIQARGIDLQVEIDPALEPQLLGDVGRLRQAFAPLIDNAVKFTDAGGVTVSVSRRPDDQVRFGFVDTGIGFDPAQKARLFSGFGQQESGLTRRFGGLGLGLTIARRLVELMGGELDAAPRPAGGSVFWADLPLPAAPTRTDVAEAEPGQGERLLRVLVADDHPTNRRVLELMLAGVAEVVSVNDGKAAVEAVEAGSFDVVLMDIQMPVMDGVTAVSRIRAVEAERATGRTPIIMLTANVHEPYVSASRAAGADRHIGKPFTADILFRAIEGVLAP
ncbi:PAS domain-containing sensor histidine kinase [Phenylobacterium sp.]|uniref:PAS domain-containing hybrid sensor histidine kinase/response regulator n=1 Tax=Phenylobacterium sp. TaxID=1871053 RepID=UPI00272F2881|nr:PAS domain-containing sensor histidine kinase [Phenylobacterium sp.]MDP1616239.1 response regulator [Phenylobacterium sp.]MDP1985765.1 response regulator [Phenylobacterium sp.]